VGFAVLCDLKSVQLSTPLALASGMFRRNTPVFSTSFVSFSVLALALGACAPQGGSNKASDAGSLDRHELVKGPLDAVNQKIQNSFYKDACDDKNADIKKEIIQALETRAEKAKATTVDTAAAPTTTAEASPTPSASSSPQKQTTAIKVPFQDGYLLKIDPLSPKSQDWRTTHYGWERIYQTFQKHKDHGNRAFWSWLNAVTRSILTDDSNRVVSLRNMGISKDNVKMLPELFEKSDACQKKEDCFSFDWNADELAVLNGIPLYAHFLKKMDEASTNERKRKVIDALSRFIARDTALYSMQANSQVRVSQENGKTIYTLAIDGAQLTDDERGFLQTSIENVWSSDTDQIHVEWGSQKTQPDLFHILFNNTTGNRSYVSRSDHAIHLFTRTDNRAVAHEFGHVLGFADHYYTLWDSEKCEYVNQINDLDLMSVAQSGSVTSDEWLELQKTYPVNAQVRP